MNETTIEDVELPDSESFTAADRCDRCGAQAYYRYTFKAGDLLFCRHHQNKYKASLDSISLVSQSSAQEKA